MVYSSISLLFAPIPHGKSLPTVNTPVVSLAEEESVSLSAGNNEDFFSTKSSKQPHVHNQQELEDLTRDEGIAKSNA
jgi:hypothetical protein